MLYFIAVDLISAPVIVHMLSTLVGRMIENEPSGIVIAVWPASDTVRLSAPVVAHVVGIRASASTHTRPAIVALASTKGLAGGKNDPPVPPCPGSIGYWVSSLVPHAAATKSRKAHDLIEASYLGSSGE